MGNNLRKYRIEKGWSTAEMCIKLNIGQSKLSRIENNDIKQIPIDILDRIKKFDPSVDLNYLLGYSEERSSESIELEKLREENARIALELQEMQKWRDLVALAIKEKES